MKMWCPKVLTNLVIDWRRISLFARGAMWERCINFLIVPMCVAWALIQIFITRGAPDTTISNFIFFSILYLFWMGLFHACTSINGAKEQGEWTYWVLGVRRCEYSVGSYVWALALFQIIQVLLVTLSFIIVVWASTVYSANYWAQAIGGRYCYGVEDTFAALGSNNGAIEAYVFGFNGNLTGWARCYFLFYFLCGLLASGISGVVLGMLVSAWVRKRGYAIFASVCITMVVTLFSVVSLAPKHVEPMPSEEKENWVWGKEFKECQQSAYFFPIYQLSKMTEQESKRQGPTKWEAFKRIFCTSVYYKEHQIEKIPTPRFFGVTKQFVLDKDEIVAWSEVETAYLNLKAKDGLEKGLPSQKDLSEFLNHAVGKCAEWAFYELSNEEICVIVLCCQEDGMRTKYYQYPSTDLKDLDFPLTVEGCEVLAGSSWNVIEGKDCDDHLTYKMAGRRTRNSWIQWFQIVSYLLPPRYAFNIAHTIIPREGVLSRGNDYYEELQDESVQKTSACLLHEIRELKRMDYKCWCVFCLDMVPAKKFHVDLENDPFWLSKETYKVNEERPFGLNERMKYYEEDIHVLQSIWKHFFVWEVVTLVGVLSLILGLIWMRLVMFSEFRQLR